MGLPGWCCLLLLIPLAAPGLAAAHHGDFVDPPEVSPGTYPGELQGYYEEDAWRIRHPVGKGVRATLTVDATASTSNLTLYILGPDGHILKDAATASLGGHAPAAGHAIGADPSGVVWVSVRWFDQGGEPPRFFYTLRLEIVDLPDYRVTAFSIEKAEPALPGLDQETRMVRISVTNAGSGEGKGWVRFHARTTLDAGWMDVAWTHANLAPGESREVTFAWDVRGLVGEVEVRASADARADPRAYDNVQYGTHVVLVDAAGLSIRAPSGEGACILYACAAHGEGDGFVHARATALIAGVYVYLWLDGPRACVFTFAPAAAPGSCTP